MENKQIKLYTEEQVREMLCDLGDLLFNNCQNGIKEDEPETYFDIILESRTPIELPSDEEIGVIALNVANTLEHKLNSQEEAFFLAGFQTCAKWVIEQIKQQDK